MRFGLIATPVGARGVSVVQAVEGHAACLVYHDAVVGRASGRQARLTLAGTLPDYPTPPALSLPSTHAAASMANEPSSQNFGSTCSPAA